MTSDPYSPTAVARGFLTRARWHLEQAAPALAALASEVAWESPAARLFRERVDTQRREACVLIDECDSASAWLEAHELRPVDPAPAEEEGR